MIGCTRACRLLTVGLAAVVESHLADVVAVQLAVRQGSELAVADSGTGVESERIVVVGIETD